MPEFLIKALIGVTVGVLVSVPTCLLLISLLRGEPVPWRDYAAHFFGRRSKH